MEEFDKASFDEDLKGVLAGLVAGRYTLEKTAELEVTAILTPLKAPAERFVARLRWTRYPDGHPSLKFLDGVGGADTVPKAWPTGQGMRPGSLDSCMHWTSEGHGLHPEWKNAAGYRLSPDGNVISQALALLQFWFDHEYTGRSA